VLDVPLVVGPSDYLDPQALNPSWSENDSDGSNAEQSSGVEASAWLGNHVRTGALATGSVESHTDDQESTSDGESVRPILTGLALALLDSLLGKSPDSPPLTMGEIELIAELVPLDKSSLALIASLLSVPRDSETPAQGPIDATIETPAVMLADPPASTGFMIGLVESFEQTRLTARSWDSASNPANAVVEGTAVLLGGPRAVSDAAFNEAIRRSDEGPLPPPQVNNTPPSGDGPPPEEERPQQTPTSVAVTLALGSSLINGRILSKRRRRGHPSAGVRDHSATSQRSGIV
jgi:hypothetical protein